MLISPQTRIPLVLTVESLGLHSTITSLHEGHDYRLRPTVSRLRDSFECGDISVMQWIPGSQNLEDALTKFNPAAFKTFNNAMVSRILPHVTLSKAHRTLYSKTNL